MNLNPSAIKTLFSASVKLQVSQSMSLFLESYSSFLPTKWIVLSDFNHVGHNNYHVSQVSVGDFKKAF